MFNRHTLWGSLLLRPASLTSLRNASDIFKQGLLILIAAGLVVGLVNSAIQLADALQAPPSEATIRRAREDFRQGMAQARAVMEIPPDVKKQIEEYVEIGLTTGLDIAKLPTRIPQPSGHILRALGGSLSTPFNWLGGWMSYTLLVAIAAHLMGGKATLQQMFGLAALCAVPHLLDIIPPLMGLIPMVGPLLDLSIGTVITIGAWIWGTLIYVAAVTVASEFDWARGLLATLAPILALVILILWMGIVGLLVLIL